MFNINKYLEKISKNIKSKDFYNDKIIDIIKNITGIDIKKEEIELKDCIVFIKNSSAVKNKIFIFKNKILEEFSKNIPDKIVDIR